MFFLLSIPANAKDKEDYLASVCHWAQRDWLRHLSENVLLALISGRKGRKFPFFTSEDELMSLY